MKHRTCVIMYCHTKLKALTKSQCSIALIMSLILIVLRCISDHLVSLLRSSITHITGLHIDIVHNIHVFVNMCTYAVLGEKLNTDSNKLASM